MKLELISPEKVVLTEEIYEAMLPTEQGQIAILPHHVPLITLLVPGVITIRREKTDDEAKLEHIAISGGFAEIGHESIKIMADVADRADDLDELKIAEAKAAAKQAASEAKDDVSYSDAVARMSAELAREKVKNLKKRHRSS